MDKSLKTLPAMSPRYKGVPTRYEETKPALMQAFTHLNILDIGQNIHSKWENIADHEKSKAVQAAEDAVWEQAEHVKTLALEKAQNNAHKELQNRIQELNEEHEKAIKGESLRVEAEMKKIALQQVQQEREHAAQVLKETVEKLIAEKDDERLKAVASAREEEINKAAEEAKRVAKETAEKEEETAKREAKSKAAALEELTERLTKERIAAIMEAQSKERQIALGNMNKVLNAHAQEVAKLYEEIRKWELKHQGAIGEVEREAREKDEWIKKYEHLKTSFQKFIDETNGFRPGQAEFLIGTL